ncbi:hypothetical protein ALC60_09242, partial [Trachymyrmex zeteki]
YFRFPLSREDHLKKWIEAIGQTDLKPSKNHVICSTHFTTDDFMDRPGTSSNRSLLLSCLPSTLT